MFFSYFLYESSEICTNIPIVDVVSWDGQVHNESYQHPDDKNMKLFVSFSHSVLIERTKDKIESTPEPSLVL